jgi:hypothetical protein
MLEIQADEVLADMVVTEVLHINHSLRLAATKLLRPKKTRNFALPMNGKRTWGQLIDLVTCLISTL